MDARGMAEEAQIAEKQAAQNAKSAAAAQEAIAGQGGVSVKEFEDTESTIHGL